MLYLNRFISDLFSTRGVLINAPKPLRQTPLCHTLELPWNNNAQNISCIPDGTYDLIRSSSTAHGPCFRIPSVSGRTGILIHAGNSLKDTRGCILVGLDVNFTNVLHSKLAMKRLFETLPDQTTLIVRTI